MPRLKAVIFDSDGTIFHISDYVPVFFDAMRQTAKLLTGKECTASEDELYDLLRFPFLESRKLVLRRLGADPDVFWNELAKLDLEKRKEMIGDKIFLKEDHRIIQKLFGRYRLGLLSMTPPEIIDFQLKHFGLDYFQAVVCSRYKCRLSKPDIKGMELVLEKLNVSPQEAVIVGDSDVDVMVGKRVGAFTVQIETPHSHYYHERGPDFRIKSLDELGDIIWKIEQMPSADAARVL